MNRFFELIRRAVVGVRQAQASHSPIRSFRPSLEALEQRVLLDTYLWRGLNNGSWRIGNNWLDLTRGGALGFANGQSLQPGDTIRFTNNANTNSIDDYPANFKVGGIPLSLKLQITDGYTATIDIRTDLIVEGESYMRSAATIAGRGVLTISGGTFTWAQGSMTGARLPGPGSDLRRLRDRLRGP
jgi:hypothetical protein